MASRLATAGPLRRGVTRPRSVDVLWLLTSFDAYDLLARGRDRSPAAVGRVLADLAEQRLG